MDLQWYLGLQLAIVETAAAEPATQIHASSRPQIWMPSEVYVRFSVLSGYLSVEKEGSLSSPLSKASRVLAIFRQGVLALNTNSKA